MFKTDHNSNQGERPPSTVLREEVLDYAGQEVISSTEGYVQMPDGSVIKQTRLTHSLAADGRWLRASEFVAVSWTGLQVPRDSVSQCLNPFEEHPFRLVYLNLDGYMTAAGNVLCSECIQIQRRRIFWKQALLFGLLYNPEEY
jgi:hypothetical protein